MKFYNEAVFETFMLDLITMLPSDQLPSYVVIDDDSYKKVSGRSPTVVGSSDNYGFSHPTGYILIYSNYQYQVKKEVEKQLKARSADDICKGE